MGKGILMPDSKSLKDCEIPVFKTHATPINVSVRPAYAAPPSTKKSLLGGVGIGGGSGGSEGGGFPMVHAPSLPLRGGGSGGAGGRSSGRDSGASQGCACVIS